MEGKNNEKFIDREILNLILPEYENLKMQPQFFINLNKDNEENNKDKHNKKNKEYFQNVSLLGPRGSGKTNALNNIIDYLKEQKNYIVFDLITPETINEEEDLLGWIISLVTEKAEEILKERKLKQEHEDNYKCNLCGNYNYEFKNKVIELNRKIKELKESYFLRRSTYNEIIANDTLSTMEYIEKKSKKLKADTNLKTSFFNLVDELVDNKEDKILIFSFDDVDIYSSKVCEVLKIIMNYLSHKNIVTYIAGDYDSFIENITIELIKKENLLDKDLLEYNFLSNGECAKNLREERAYEFLKKVLPPKYRYYIKSINNKNKVQIIKVYDKKLKSLIDDEIVKNIIGYIKYDEDIINDYFDFMDDKIRGLTNVIEFVFKEYSNLKESLNSNKDDFKLKCKFLNKILDCIIHTNINLEKYEDLIRKVINIPNANKSFMEFTGYVNYRFIINEFISKEEYELNSKSSYYKENLVNPFKYEKFKEIYKIFILSNFFEIMIEVLMNRNSSIHGKDELLKVINTLNNNNDGIKLLPNLENVKEIIYLKEKIFENLRYEEIISLFSKQNASNYLRYIYLKTFSNYKVLYNKYNKKNDSDYIVNVVFKDLIDKDYSWCDKQIKWIYKNIFNRKKIIEELNQNIRMEFKDIDEFLMISNVESEIKMINLKKKRLNKKYDKFTLENILNLFDSIISLETAKEKIESLNISLEEKKEEKSEVIKKIDNIYINLTSELRENKAYRKNIFNKVKKIIMKEIVEFLDDEKNKELWNNIAKDCQIIEGIIDKNKLEEKVSKSFIFKEIDLNKWIEKYELEHLNIKNTIFTVAILNRNITFASNEENQKRIINYLEYMLLRDELNKCGINDLDNLEEYLKKLDDEIFTRNNDIEIEKKNYKNIKDMFEDNPSKYLYNEETKELNKNIPFILINQINDEKFKYKKLYLNLSLKRVYEEIKNKTFKDILNLKIMIEQFYESNKENLKEYFAVNSIIERYLSDFKVFNYTIREIRNLKNILGDLNNELNKKKIKNEREINFENQIDNLIFYVEYVLRSENNSILESKKNILLVLLKNIVLEIIRIEVEYQQEGFNNRSTSTSLEILKKDLNYLRDNGDECTLKLYLENMGNDKIESVLINVK